MTMRKMLSAIVMAAMFMAACGKSEQQKQAEKAAEDLKKAAEAMGQAAANAGTAAAAQGATDMAKAMAGMAAAMGGKTADGKPVEPIAFQSLQTALPEVSGWEMDKPKGEKMTSPMPFSKTETDYRNGDQRIDMSITDTALSAMFLIPLRMAVASGFSRETSDGYEKATTVGGQPAVEKWNAGSKRGELNVLVNDRFVVEIVGHNVAGIKTLHDFAAKTDFAKLASLK
jgi:uncharacterized protein YqcC (DUF446 family)